MDRRPRVGRSVTGAPNAPAGPDRGERLQKFIARAGVASRRRAETLIVSGRVRVNGRTATVLGTRVRPEVDEVRVDGVRVQPAPIRWVMLNKPPGFLTTRRDDRGRDTVYDLLPESLRGLVHVGRLDRATEGLLLLTNDGEAANMLAHPRYRVEREYRAWVAGLPSRDVLRRLVSGVKLEDGLARAKRARVLERGSPRSVLELVLTEGRKREVRRLCRAVRHPVQRLERVRFGPIRLAGLGRGEWRDLTEAEVAALAKLSAFGFRAPRGRPRPGADSRIVVRGDRARPA